MKIYLKTNVYDAAVKRINYLFDEFPEVVVGISGGKDSTVVLNLALRIATERNRLPLKVMFLDQEAEWDSAIDYIRTVMNDPRIKPYWLQVPFNIFNATSSSEQWLKCWDPTREKDWMREREPNSIKENIYGTDRFAEMFTAFARVAFPKTKMCYLSGMRADESMTRYVGLTSNQTYKHISYGKILDKRYGQYTFYPIYDWCYSDVWKAIHENGWEYCSLYDTMFQYGIPIRNMRVSNVTHETAVRSLYFMQEFEPRVWNKLTKRIGGVKMAAQLREDAFMTVRNLPPMFESWKEYRDYLVDNLLATEEARVKFQRKFAQMDEMYDQYPDKDDMFKSQIAAVLANDHYMTKIGNWERSPLRHLYRRRKSDPNYEVYSGKYVIEAKP